MPLYRVGAKLELLCINAVGGMSLDPAVRAQTPTADTKHRMERVTHAVLLPLVLPPKGGGAPAQTFRGVAYYPYVCQECGYVEFYSATLVDPEEWPRGK